MRDRAPTSKAKDLLARTSDYADKPEGIGKYPLSPPDCWHSSPHCICDALAPSVVYWNEIYLGPLVAQAINVSEPKAVDSFLPCWIQIRLVLRSILFQFHQLNFSSILLYAHLMELIYWIFFYNSFFIQIQLFFIDPFPSFPVESIQPFFYHFNSHLDIIFFQVNSTPYEPKNPTWESTQKVSFNFEKKLQRYFVPQRSCILQN